MNSLTQGQTFAKMTAPYHGGKRSRKMTRRRRVARKQRGGAFADYQTEFSVPLSPDMQDAAQVSPTLRSMAELSQFVGKYGNMTGGRRSRKQRGGVADVTASAMILTPAEEAQAFLNPQWYTENQVVPGFVGPTKGGKRRRARKTRHRRRRTVRKH
jgi:hypothetical protein